ncbi:MAG TPA: C39 family peptidase [Ktedonobacteraceae bacterium]|nr:C39 family peptidase [Ktedonobacteraceae bacterium]
MLSAVITAFLLFMVVLIIGSITISVLLEHRRHARKLALQAQESGQSPDRRITLVLQLQDGTLLGVEKPLPPPAFTLPSSWYTRHRMLVSTGLLIMVLLTLFVQSGIVDGALHQLSNGISLLSFAQHTTGIGLNTTAHQAPGIPLTASQRLVRIDSADRKQYYSDYQWNVWSYSSCSGISMEEVMNAYGRHFIAADVLQEELKLGVWSVYGGLLREDGIALTATYFGFSASLSNARTLNDIINLSNKGYPVIVSVRDSFYFPGGHLFVIRGGDSSYVYIADSSPANFQRMTHTMFSGMWRGFSAVLTPR